MIQFMLANHSITNVLSPKSNATEFEILFGVKARSLPIRPFFPGRERAGVDRLSGFERDLKARSHQRVDRSPLWKTGPIGNERALIRESICWSKIQHFTVANIRFTAPLTRRSKIGDLKMTNSCLQFIQSETCYPQNLMLLSSKYFFRVKTRSLPIRPFFQSGRERGLIGSLV